MKVGKMVQLVKEVTIYIVRTPHTNAVYTEFTRLYIVTFPKIINEDSAYCPRYIGLYSHDTCLLRTVPTVSATYRCVQKNYI